MEYNDIEKLVKLVEDSSIDEIEYRNESERIRIRKNASCIIQGGPPVAGVMTGAPAVTPTVAPSVAASDTAEVTKPEKDDSIVEVIAPSVGTVSLNDYETGNQIVKVGDIVKSQDRVCMLEAMKMYMDIVAPVNGTILSIEVKNGEIVEYGQLIAKIRKDS